MPKFYINFQNTKDISSEDEGQDLPGLEEARAVAMKSAREVLADRIKYATGEPLIAVIVTDENGQEVARISAKDILPVK
jgi:hypothetical protein